jgi:tRNA-splicing ligase RtcB
MAVKIRKINDYTWEIPKEDGMLVPGRVFASAALLEDIRDDKSLEQVRNVAHLPGIVGHSLAMPDIHQGYGFPIGGVAATREADGVISPGGVGYDINCGVRLVATRLHEADVRPRLDALVDALYNAVPTGVGASSGFRRLDEKELRRVVERGARWPVENGYGRAEDLAHIEELGCLQGADPDAVSPQAYARGREQLGSLGSGNHFLEVEVVDEIFRPEVAEVLGLGPRSVVFSIHSGSRGFGHQICTDYLRVMDRALTKYGIHLPDRQLACAPLDSEEGRGYMGAMKAAANFAWANRQTMMGLALDAFEKVFGMGPRDLGATLIYDVCHNIAKMEEHVVEGRQQRVCVHRKGATRAFPPHHPLTPDDYREVGQPVFIPGDMGRYSYVLVGQPQGMEQTFGSSCHGAGRLLSRTAALKAGKGRRIQQELLGKGIHVRARGMRTLAEEMPDAYKDVAEVVKVMDALDLSHIVARLVPVAVIKG